MKSIFIPWKRQPKLGVSVANRNDYADYDYISDLSPYELKWLKGFHREYVNADFKHSHKKHFKSKSKKKICYDLNNSRNRCIYNELKWKNLLLLSKDVSYKNNGVEYKYHDIYEDYLIALLDKDY